MDLAHEWTEGEIKELERRIREDFAQAEREVEQKLRDHLDHFHNNEAVWKRKVKDGKATEKEYQDWRMGQIAVGKRWETLRSEIAKDYANASEIARSMTRERAIGVYATNHSFATYQIEQQARVDTSYTLYDRSTVERLMRDNPKVMHDPGKAKSERIRQGLEQKWNERQLQSVMVQGILQGESIPRLAERLAKTVGDKDMNAAIRNARTAMTGAQNAGRIDSYRRANDLGIKVRKCWIAAHDGRTRHWHAELDGQTAEVDEPFVNEYGEIMYPGDPGAEPANIYNCRCTLASQVKGRETDVMGYRKDSGEGYKSYDDWLKEHGRERGWYKKESDKGKTQGERKGGKAKTFTEKINELREKVNKDGLTDEVIMKAGEVLADELLNNKEITDGDARKNADILKSVLGQVREMGADGIDLKSHLNNSKSQVREDIEWAYEHYPKSWIEKSVAAGKIVPKEASRGYYIDGNMLGFPLKKAKIGIGEGGVRTAFHELGHRFEKVTGDILKREKEFYERRTQGEKLERLRDITGRNYKPSEISKKDAFIDAYMGKWYNGKGYELASMGFEYAYTNPRKLAQDNDMLRWILGLLAFAE